MPKRMEITLELHNIDGQLLLHSSDIYSILPDTTEKEAELNLYIDKWCQYLNRLVTDNKEMAFGNVELARLDGWIKGYETAKGYLSDYLTNKGYVVIAAGKYIIKLAKPYEVKEQSLD